MKKNYIKPSCSVYLLDVETSILAASTQPPYGEAKSFSNFVPEEEELPEPGKGYW